MYFERTAWDTLRATRSTPPGLAGSTPERRAVYNSALEQAEQFFKAASAVGPATQPVLAFYGLSQAGRAIAAAATALNGAEDWKLKGHGIQTKDEDGPLPDVTATTDTKKKDGSFCRLSELLGSPLWGAERVSLAELWDCLPVNYEHPIGEKPESRRMPLYVDDRAIWRAERESGGGSLTLVSAPVACFPPHVGDAQDITKAFTDYVGNFPEAMGFQGYYRLGPFNGAPPRLQRHDNGWYELTINWALPDGAPGTYPERLAHLHRITRQYDGRRFFFPAIRASATGIHPLMAWWAVLHTLSTVSRYQPAEWGQHIDVDQSRHAVPIERLLGEAIRVLPQLVAETLEEVAGTTRAVPPQRPPAQSQNEITAAS